MLLYTTNEEIGAKREIYAFHIIMLLETYFLKLFILDLTRVVNSSMNPLVRLVIPYNV